MDSAYWQRAGFNRGRVVTRQIDAPFIRVRMEGHQACCFMPTEVEAAQTATRCIANASHDGWVLQRFGSGVKKEGKDQGREVFWAEFLWTEKTCKKHGSPLVPSGIDGKLCCLDCPL